MLAELCPPALIYLIFSLTQIVIDTIKGFYNTAFLKIWVTFAFTVLLNTLCKNKQFVIADYLNPEQLGRSIDTKSHEGLVT